MEYQRDPQCQVAPAPTCEESHTLAQSSALLPSYRCDLAVAVATSTTRVINSWMNSPTEHNPNTTAQVTAERATPAGRPLYGQSVSAWQMVSVQK